MTRATVVLSTAESARLNACETVIARGLRSFNEVGSALMRIRDERLYRARFATFEAYCTEQWGLSGSRAYQLVDAAQVSELISSTIVEEINNEAQARELAPLLDDPDQMREVWSEANRRTDGKATAAAVRAVRDERTKTAAGDTPPPADGRDRADTDRSATTVAPTVGADVNAPSAPTGTPQAPGHQGREFPETTGTAVSEATGDAVTEAAPLVGDEVSRPVPAPADGPGTDPEPPAYLSRDSHVIDAEANRRATQGLDDALMTLWSSFEPDPVEFFNRTWQPTFAKYRGMPRLGEIYQPAGLRGLAKYLDALADHLDATEQTL